MHMFELHVITNYVNGMVETSTVLLNADSHEQAFDLVCQQLNLPTSRTRVVDSKKIKPAVRVLENRQSFPTAKVSLRSQRDAVMAPVQRFHITVDANTHGQSEQQVMRKVGEELQARGAQTKLRHNIPMKIECETVQPKERASSPLERIEMFRSPNAGRVFGGRMRGK